MFKQKLLVFSTLLGLCVFGGAYAGTAGSTIDVSVTVTGGCTVSTSSPFIIPDYDGSTDVGGPLGTIGVTCTSGVLYNIGLDGGQNYAGDQRFLSNGLGDLIAYGLMTEADPFVFWGDSDTPTPTNAWLSVAGTGTGTLQTHTVPGGIQAGTLVPVGDYSDVVTVTVHY